MTVAAATGGGGVADWRSTGRGGIGSLIANISQQALSSIYFSLYGLSD